jgi:chromosome segregation ATPase
MITTKRLFLRILLLLSIVFLFCGSAPNGGPLEGGFVTGCAGLTSGRYKDRIVQRQNQLAELQYDTEQMQIQLSQIEALNQAGLEQKRNLEQELLDLQQDIEEQKKKLDSLKENHMQEELDRLVQKKERIERQIEELAVM